MSLGITIALKRDLAGNGSVGQGTGIRIGEGIVIIGTHDGERNSRAADRATTDGVGANHAAAPGRHDIAREVGAVQFEHECIGAVGSAVATRHGPDVGAGGIRRAAIGFGLGEAAGYERNADQYFDEFIGGHFCVWLVVG